MFKKFIELPTALFLIFGLFNSVQCSAFTIDEYKQKINEGGKAKEYMEMYVMGMGQGFHWANTAVRLDNQKTIFCPPRNLKINGDLILTMMNDGLLKTELKGTSSIELLMLQQFTYVFPCK
jgi:hypothetical protein